MGLNTILGWFAHRLTRMQRRRIILTTLVVAFSKKIDQHTAEKLSAVLDLDGRVPVPGIYFRSLVGKLVFNVKDVDIATSSTIVNSLPADWIYGSAELMQRDIRSCTS